MEAATELAAKAQGLLASYHPAKALELATGGFADWLEVRQSNSGDKLQLQLRPTSVLAGNKVKYHALLRLWAGHLLANGTGHLVDSKLLAPDAELHLARGPQNAAPILAAFKAALNGPLPVAPRTAFAYLAALDKGEEAAIAAAQKAYDGDDFSPGEREQDLYCARAYPSFADMDTDHFKALAQSLYAPLTEAVQ